MARKVRTLDPEIHVLVEYVAKNSLFRHTPPAVHLSLSVPGRSPGTRVPLDIKVELDRDAIIAMCCAAVRNKSRRCQDGPIKVTASSSLGVEK